MADIILSGKEIPEDLKEYFEPIKNSSDIFTIPTSPSSEKHFAMWPEKLVERMILCSTKVGDIVVDPFAGSLTTLRVAERINRNGIGIELGYKDMLERRIKNIQKELGLR